jgi:hypothetical protein
MIELVLAAAAALPKTSPNRITAPYGIHAHAQWAATPPNVQLVIENTSNVKAWLLDVTCNAYDARGALVAVATADLPELNPGERATTFAIAEDRVPAARFVCKVAVSDWRLPAKK